MELVFACYGAIEIIMIIIIVWVTSSIIMDLAVYAEIFCFFFYWKQASVDNVKQK